MRIAVDAFGGDNAPLAIIQGAYDAMKELNVDITLTGDEQKIKEVAKENNIDISAMEIVHAPLVIPVEEDAEKILKEYKESSMTKSLELVAQGKADAVVSAGSTGAFAFGTTFIVKRIKGIKRVALATVIPCEGGNYLLIDLGANAECRPEMLLQFGVMGCVYMEKVMGVKTPRVALVNNGAEETKGTQLQIDAYKLLKESNLNFVGNIEPRYIPLGQADVVVCDGFTGNVVLKLTEGMAKFFEGALKKIFLGSFISKLAAVMVMGSIKDFRKNMDYKEYGGAMLIGATKTVIKAHGSSDARAFKNAIKQAKKAVETGVVERIANASM